VAQSATTVHETVEDLYEERRTAIDKLVRSVYDGSESVRKLSDEIDHYARLTTMHLLDGSLDAAKRSADLWQRATSARREYFASEEFTRRAGLREAVQL
jgi:uncharacterized protein YoxC